MTPGELLLLALALATVFVLGVLLVEVVRDRTVARLKQELAEVQARLAALEGEPTGRHGSKKPAPMG